MNQPLCSVRCASFLVCGVGLLACGSALAQPCLPRITANPQSASTCTGTATFTVSAASDTPVMYRWEILTGPPGIWRGLGNDPMPLPCEGGFAHASLPFGSSSPIGVHRCPGVNQYLIRAAVTNACGTTFSDPARLTISSADFNGDGDVGTDQDIEAFFACLAGNCCVTCGTADFNGDGDVGTDQDIEAFFRVLAGGSC